MRRLIDEAVCPIVQFFSEIVVIVADYRQVIILVASGGFRAGQPANQSLFRSLRLYISGHVPYAMIVHFSRSLSPNRTHASPLTT